MQNEDHDSNPIRPGLVPHLAPSVSVPQDHQPPPSLATLSMACVIKYPDLLEEICTFLTYSLRKEMIAMTLDPTL